MGFAENSAEDLVLRGFSQAEIQDKIGIDVGYHGRNFRDALAGIDRKAYKVQYVRQHCDEAKLRDVLSQYAKGLSKGETLALMDIAGANIINLKWLFSELGMADAFKKADTKHRNTVMKDGMKDKYGVDNPFKLDEFQEAGKKTRKGKYGAEYTLQKESSLEKGAREHIRQQREISHPVHLSGAETRRRAEELLAGTYRRWTTETFIEAASQIHGHYYDYSKTVYTKRGNNVIITCPKHGNFEQRAGNHLRGMGCPKCSGNVTLTVDEFVAKSRAIHGDKYDYLHIKKIKSSHSKVEIICPEHGSFMQTVTHHLSGEGCPLCMNACRKATNLQRYGMENAGGTSDSIAKAKRTNLERYGAEHIMQTDDGKHRLMASMRNIYGVDYAVQSEEVKAKARRTNRERYGVDYPMQNKIFSKRNYEAKKRNGTLNTSSVEEHCANLTGFDRQYRDDVRYPYACDFYDASTDAFIEINASWTHGLHWFGSGSNDAGKLKRWKKNGSDYYMNAVRVWSERDVEKRDCARRHHLNYVTLWDAKGTDAELWLAMGCPTGHDYDHEYSWLPERHIATDVDISKMKLSWGQLQAIVKDAQRSVFYEHEIKMWEENHFRRNSWGTVQAFLYANRWKYIHKLPDELTDREILRGFRISGLYIGFTSFDPEMMKKVISKYGVKSVYDPCSGWGERMMTCGMLGVGYEGCDINDRLQTGYAKLAAKIDGFAPVMHVGDSARQTVETDADAVITCPPYMSTEIYSDDGAEHYDAKQFAAWWDEVVARCSASQVKVFAVQTNQACRQVFLSGLERHGWRLAEELTYENEKKSHFHRYGTKTKREFESMFVMIR
jgi:hypothetical protein